ncbi:MAG TPA: hypothetical protein VIJ93_09360, partial [bacterium]
MKKLLFLLIALVLGLPLTAVKVSAAEEPREDSDYEDKPAEISVSDIEGLSNRINDLAKFAKVSVLLQVQYLNSGFNSAVGKGFASPIKVSAAT